MTEPNIVAELNADRARLLAELNAERTRILAEPDPAERARRLDEWDKRYVAATPRIDTPGKLIEWIDARRVYSGMREKAGLDQLTNEAIHEQAIGVATDGGCDLPYPVPKTLAELRAWCKSRDNAGMQGAWRHRPFDPAGDPVESDGPTIEAVRRVIADWDGDNWDTMLAVLRLDYDDETIRALTVSQIRQIFAVRQREIVVRLGGQAETHTNTIRAVNPPAIEFGADVASDAGWTPGELAGDVGVSADTLRRYATAAGVATPERGNRGFKYSREDRRRIFAYAKTSAGDRTVKARAKELLGQLPD